MATATANGFFREHFLAPATTTITELKNGAQNSITRADISGYLTNAIICAVPLIAGGGVAYAINQYIHQHVVHKLPGRSVISFLVTTFSVITGAAVSFFVVRLLSANHITLSPLTADKALRLETLHVVVMSAITPLALYFKVPLFGFYSVPAFFGAAAVSGYFGERSLYVIGLLSALNFGINPGLMIPPKPRNTGLLHHDTDSFSF
jgi:hypothetical protein